MRYPDPQHECVYMKCLTINGNYQETWEFITLILVTVSSTMVFSVLIYISHDCAFNSRFLLNAKALIHIRLF